MCRYSWAMTMAQYGIPIVKADGCDMTRKCRNLQSFVRQSQEDRTREDPLRSETVGSPAVPRQMFVDIEVQYKYFQELYHETFRWLLKHHSF